MTPVLCLLQPTMRFLIQILDKADIARKGDWTVGNCVLAVCYSILLHHNSSSTITGDYFSKCYLAFGNLLVLFLFVLFCFIFFFGRVWMDLSLCFITLSVHDTFCHH